jgi:methionine-rich copper-binding protein CopC
MNRLLIFVLIVTASLTVARIGSAHAFLDHAEPAVGSKVRGSPAVVRIWFSEKLEPAMCKLQVFDESGQEIDKHDVASAPDNSALLTVSLPVLKPGKYKVSWRAVSVDTHVTKGDFSFEVTE